MVLCGGLEFVAAGVVYHEYQKHKREKARLEDEREQAIERRRRDRHRRHSESTERPRPRPSKADEDFKYGYKPQPTSNPGVYNPGSRPAAAVTGLYGATLSPPPARPYSKTNGYGGNGNSASMLALPAPPMRPSSAPTVNHPSQYQGQGDYQNFNLNSNPPSYMMAQNATYHSGLGPMAPQPYSQQHYTAASSSPPPLPPAGTDPRIHAPLVANQAMVHHSPSQSPYSPYPSHDIKSSIHPTMDPRRNSDTSLPLGVYEPSTAITGADGAARPGIYELSGDNRPWIHDGHRMSQSSSPHVRFRLPNHRIVETGPRASIVETETPPPAYRP